MGIITIIIIYILFIVIPTILVAKAKNKDLDNAVEAALFFGIFALIYYIFVSAEKEHEEKNTSKEEKSIPSHNVTKEIITHEKYHKSKKEISPKWDLEDIGFILLPIMLLGLGIYFYFYSRLNIIPVILTLIILTPLFDKGFKFIFKKSTFKWSLLRKGLLISAIVIVFIIINLILPRCPKICEDTTPCTKEICSAETGYKCLHVPQLSCDGNSICEAGEYGRSVDCPNCDDGNKCTGDYYDVGTKSCAHMAIKGCIRV
jgi:hypothetical protein